MTAPEAMAARRSVRKYTEEPLTRAQIEAVLAAGTLAPSAKNRQPWQFTVVQGGARAEMADALEVGLAEEELLPALPRSRFFRRGAKRSFDIMRAAPATVFVTHPGLDAAAPPATTEARLFEMADVQSVGACIQNMCLAAESEGLATLWVCDIFFAWPALHRWLGTEGACVAALCLGHAAEAPLPRPRKPVAEITEWRG